MAKTIDRYELVSGAEAQCFITVDGNRYNFANAKSLDAKIEKTKKEVPVLGKRSKVNISSSLTYKGSAKLYYNSSILREAMYRYKTTGVTPAIKIEVTNRDPATNIGGQEVVLTGVDFNSITLTKFDIESEDPLDEDVEFTFEDFEINEKFAILQSMM